MGTTSYGLERSCSGAGATGRALVAPRIRNDCELLLSSLYQQGHLIRLSINSIPPFASSLSLFQPLSISALIIPLLLDSD